MRRPLPAKTEKACALVLRAQEAGAELLLFRHPRAGVQIVKGSLEPGEAPQDAAKRELAEEAGVVAVGTRSLCVDVIDGAAWHYVLCDTDPLPDSWRHDCADDGGHVFSFFWAPLRDGPPPGWHPGYVAGWRAALAAAQVV